MITNPTSPPCRSTLFVATGIAALGLLVTFTQAPAQPTSALPATDPSPPAITPQALPAPQKPGESVAKPNVTGSTAPLADNVDRAAAPSESDVDVLRQEVTGLRNEIARLRQILPVSSREILSAFQMKQSAREQQLQIARAEQLRKLSSGYGPAHPQVVSGGKRIDELERQVLVETTSEKAEQYKIAQAKKHLVNQLVELKSSEAEIRTTLEIPSILTDYSSPSEHAAEQQKRSSLYKQLGQLRARIQEIETRLNYNLLD